MQRISGGELSHLSKTEVATLLDRAYNRDEDDLYDTRPYRTRSLMHQVLGACLETPCTLASTENTYDHQTKGLPV